MHVQQGLPLFLVWYADLDAPSVQHKTPEAANSIKPATLAALSNASDTIHALNKRVVAEETARREGDEAIQKRLSEIDKALEGKNVRSGIVITLLIGAALFVGGFVVKVFTDLRPVSSAPGVVVEFSTAPASTTAPVRRNAPQR